MSERPMPRLTREGNFICGQKLGLKHIFKTMFYKTCICGEGFEVFPYRKNTSKFCSRACSAKYRVKKPKGYKCPKGSLAKMGIKNPQFGKLKKNPSYCAIHGYIRKRLKKPRCCERCGLEKPLDMANKSHQYKRDLSDWMWLCRRCHQDYDGNRPPINKRSGYKLSEEHRRKLSIAHLGQIPWNKK